MDLPPLQKDWPRTSWNRPGPFLLSDDPADHGLSESEVACIEKAYEIRRRELHAALMQPDPFGHGWELSGFEWPKTLKERMKWLLLVPIIIALLAIPQLVTAPFRYVAHRRELARRTARHRTELAQLERRPFLQPLPDKTPRKLWSVYGLERDRFSESVGVELASAWIDRLYGPETTRAVNLLERMERVNKRRALFRTDAPHFGCVLFTPPLEQVLQELSVELPPYDWATRTTASQQLFSERLH